MTGPALDLYQQFQREKRARLPKLDTTAAEGPSLYDQFKAERAPTRPPPVEDEDHTSALSDAAAQPFAAAANLVTTTGEGALRLGSGLAKARNRLLGKLQGVEVTDEPNMLDRGADALRERRAAVNEATAPTTKTGKVASVVSNIAALALPAVATGGTYGALAGAAASAGATGLQSQAGRDASITGMVGDLTESPIIDKLADNPLTRTALDVGLDVGLSGMSSKVAGVVAKRAAAKAAEKTAKSGAILDAIKKAKGPSIIDKIKGAADDAPSDLYQQFKTETAEAVTPRAPLPQDAANAPAEGLRPRPLTVPIEEPMAGVVGARPREAIAARQTAHQPDALVNAVRTARGLPKADEALGARIDKAAEDLVAMQSPPPEKGLAPGAARAVAVGDDADAALEREAMQGEAAGLEALPIPQPKGIRTPSGKIKANLAKASDGELGTELKRLMEANTADESLHSSVQESGYRGDYNELPRTEKLGRRGQEDLPDADGNVDADRLAADNKVVSGYKRAAMIRASREKAIERIEAELARRGVSPDDALWAAEPFDIFSNPMMNPKLLKRALGSRLGQSASLAATGQGLQESDDEKIRATGMGLMGLAAVHAVGANRFRAGGRYVGGKAVAALKDSPAGVRILNAISHDILADPKVRTLIDAYDEGIAGARARAAELSKRAKALGPSGDRTVSDLIEGESFEPLTTDQTVAMAVAQRISDEFTALGQEKIAAGLLSPATVAKREGKYLPRLYAEHLGDAATKDRPGPLMASLSGKVRIRPDKARLDDLSTDARNELGEIREASFRTAHGIQKGYSDVAAAKLFAGLRDMPGVIHPEFEAGVEALNAARRSGDAGAIKAAKEQLAAFSAQYVDGADGFVKLPDTPGMGVMRGAVVRKDVAGYLNGVPTLGGKAGDLLTYWKRVHTVLNPGTHIGNIASNSVIGHMFGLPIWEQPAAIKAAAQDFDSYGPVTQFLAEKGILAHGLPTASEAVPGGGRSLKTTLTQLAGHTRPETAAVLAEKGITPRRAPFRAVGKVASKMEDLYAKEDAVFRVATFNKLVGDGMDADEAAKVVDRAFVNYTTHSPLLGVIKNTVSPFIMYPVRAIPAVTGQIVEHPWRWATLAAAWGGLDQYSRHKVGKIAEADLRPADRTNKALGYLAPGFTQLPIKSKRGEKYGVDLARFTPFSALTGAPAPGSAAFAAFGERTPGILQPSGPLIDIGARLTNTDPFTGDKLVKPGAGPREKLGVLASSIASLALPSALSFQVPRVVGDLADHDPKAAAVDALGLAGARPRVIRPGMQALNEEREFENARTQIISDLRRDLKTNNNPSRAAALRLRAANRLQALAKDFQESRGK